jgi:hypothetical protein
VSSVVLLPPTACCPDPSCMRKCVLSGVPNTFPLHGIHACAVHQL